MRTPTVDETAAAYGSQIKSGMTNKNNVMLDLIQHPCGVDGSRNRVRSFAAGEAVGAYGFRIKSGMTT
ncbi:hypothetical protein [Inquilinus sp. CAU 1745]|uniref:hypothetical protein n=1 Tax=Inquilinus sp. CAU 1745 TaxID=3140369 RepID=UPI00325BC170